MMRALALTGVAVSALTPARAITIGEVAVDSVLGEALNARIPVALGPGEYLDSPCVSVPAGRSADLARLPQPQVSVPQPAASGALTLRVTTARPLYEPMYELQLQEDQTGPATT